MQVIVAPVSNNAGKVVMLETVRPAGVIVPNGSTATLSKGPIAGSNLPLRHGMREKSEIRWAVDHFLN
jgi:hypothetical protein